MKFFSTLLLLAAPLLATANEEEQRARALEIGDWSVNFKTIDGQDFTYETGPGAGENVNVKISVENKCRQEAVAAERTNVGHFYPNPDVSGIAVDTSGIVNDPGMGINGFSFSFVEGVNENALIYSEADDGLNAAVNFCVVLGLYSDIMLIDFAEVKLTYLIDLVTQVPTLTGYTVTQAEAFTDAEDTTLSFDGSLLAYFCDPDSYQILTNDGSDAVTTQGSTLNVCFRVEEGQFQVKDIMEFTVRNAEAAEPSQLIITESAPASTIFSTKKCVDEGNDNNVCLVSFLLFADFYDFEALTLTGEGSILLELGGTATAPAGRRLRKNIQIVDGHRKLQNEVTETVDVQPQPFAVEKHRLADSSAGSLTTYATMAAMAGAAMVL
ncbi:expressed unknown protein [Seminavis robusta]|uniref:Uncharacterized protein n=1 Tax=Seminavis robusta TaxID=568900 RepID=A0A9N8D9R5_9STRA|nr:expressed unknown protein [Seminavis robusta]|eukprot:Sro10_g008070.1 n/a (382) ;mRNA; f:108185-109330